MLVSCPPVVFGVVLEWFLEPVDEHTSADRAAQYLREPGDVPEFGRARAKPDVTVLAEHEVDDEDGPHVLLGQENPGERLQDLAGQALEHLLVTEEAAQEDETDQDHYGHGRNYRVEPDGANKPVRA